MAALVATGTVMKELRKYKPINPETKPSEKPFYSNLQQRIMNFNAKSLFKKKKSTTKELDSNKTRPYSGLQSLTPLMSQ